MQKNKFLIIFSIAILIVSITIELKAEELTLKDTANYLLKNSSQLKNATNDIELSNLDLNLAKKGLSPEVTLQASYTRLGEAPETPTEYVFLETGTTEFQGFTVPKYQLIPVEFEEVSQDNYNTTLSVNKPLYLGGKVKNSIKLSEKVVDLNKLRYEQTLNNTLNNLIQAYFNVLIKEDLVDIQKNSLILVNSHLENVRKNYEAGLVIKSDLNQVKIEVNKTKQSILSAENDLKIAKKRLADLLKLDSNDYTLKKPEIPKFNKELDFLLEKAYRNRFEVRSILLNQEIQDINKKLENTLYKPSFFLRGNYSFEGSNLDFNNGNLTMTVSGSIPLYDGNKSKIKQKKIELEKKSLDNNLSQIKDSIATEVMAALYKIDQNYESFNIAKENEQQAVENYNQAVNRYKNGVKTSLDVIRAETNLKQIRISKNQTYKQYLISIYNLLYQTGTLNNYFEEVILNESK
ncbi:MAG: TolC family protein [Halanaerobiales bacterium]|nr:TolC family protein [Halanaerobiales bacterium]